MIPENQRQRKPQPQKRNDSTILRMTGLSNSEKVLAYGKLSEINYLFY